MISLCSVCHSLCVKMWLERISIAAPLLSQCEGWFVSCSPINSLRVGTHLKKSAYPSSWCSEMNGYRGGVRCASKLPDRGGFYSPASFCTGAPVTGLPPPTSSSPSQAWPSFSPCSWALTNATPPLCHFSNTPDSGNRGPPEPSQTVEEAVAQQPEHSGDSGCTGHLQEEPQAPEENVPGLKTASVRA